MFAKRNRRSRRGIILLVALGLLALFGILIAAYLTFASDSRKAAFNSARRDFRARDPEQTLHEAMMQILRGTTDPYSALFRQDLLGDYYGYHSTAMGTVPAESEQLVVAALDPRQTIVPIQMQTRARGVLGIGGNVVKVPIRFDVRQPAAAVAASNTVANLFPENIFNNGVYASPFNLDDTLAGRTVTMLGGPLAGSTLRITRWMGFRPATNTQEFDSRYSMFVQLEPDSLPSTVILDDGSVWSLETLLDPSNPLTGPLAAAALFYSAGANNQFGSSGSPSDAGLPGSDDLPFPMVINPIPLNGSGTGVRRDNGFTQTLTLSNAPAIPVAFQPNASRWFNPLNPPAIFGNADEPYDSPDYENLFLSHTQTDPFGSRITPSFHRPALINYLRALFPTVASGSPTNPEFLAAVEVMRRATLRPLPLYEDPAFPVVGSNSRFTGGNRNFVLASPNRLASSADVVRFNALVSALVNGPWDVDNDGDGIEDSVWTNAQLPIVTAPDGTLLRPLIAVKIDDLSARFNLNAHGNPAQLTDSYLQRFNQPLAGLLTAGGTVTDLPSGRGYGPAEVFPLLRTTDVVTNNASPQYGRLNNLGTQYAELDQIMASRYASATGAEILPWTVAGAVPQWQNPPAMQPGMRGDVPGDFDNDFQDRRMRPNLPQIHTRFTRYGFPLDMFGRGGLGIDASGNLLSSAAGTPLMFNPNTNTSFVDESLNDPYEFDPSGFLSGDSPFRFDELESVLNANRWDTHLYPGRINSLLASSLSVDPSVANIVTTYSASDVRPNPTIVQEFKDQTGARLAGNITTTPPVLVESLLARVIGATGSTMTGQLTAADLELAEVLLAPELRLGMPINVNRPLGNGLDDNGNGVIDEPREMADRIDDNGNGTIDEALEGEEQSFDGVNQVAYQPSGPTFNGVYYSAIPTFNGAGIAESPGQALARHLFCTAMLLAADDNANLPRWTQDATNLGTPALQRQYRAHRLAQWAVNVVDYRDGDGIMTRFVYDFNLVNGWNPNLATNAGETGEVWGCEHPELLFMESFAAHDLRVKDTSLDTSGDDKAGGDPHVDQIRMPQGTAILELYNPRPKSVATVANHEALPTDLYGVEANVPVLDLDRAAPGLDANNDGDFTDAGDTLPVPIWRIAISEPHPEVIDDTDSPLDYRTRFPDTASFDPTITDELNLAGAPRPLALERFVVFGNYARPDAVALADTFGVSSESAIFSNLTGGSANLPVGSYLTVAPRTDTRLGSVVTTANPTGLSNQRFELLANEGLVYFDGMGVRQSPGVYPVDNAGDIQAPLVFLAQAHPPTFWGGLNAAALTQLFGLGNRGIGFNVSEPVIGTTHYRLPEDYLLGQMGAFPLRDAYWDYLANEGTLNGNQATTIDDTPYDLNTNYPIGALTNTLTPGSDSPFIGSANNYCTAFLQRLADPTIPLQEDPTLAGYNPYRTVDWIPMDLTVFSGDELEDVVNTRSRYASVTRQRTGEERTGAATENLLFANRVNDPPLVQLGATGAGQPYFNLDVDNSVGYLNASFGTRHTFATAGNIASFIGLPQNVPFAMHPWLNRPYASPLELMFVPACSQARLMEECGLVNNVNAYAGGANLAQAPTFGHLLNFLDSINDETDGTHLYRIFDYLGTGSKFRGSTMPESPLTNGTMGVPNPPTTTAHMAALNAQTFWREAFQFPLNQQPAYSEQGRINLNTIGDSRVYAGLLWAHLPADERAAYGQNVWTNFVASRRGFAPGGTYNLASHLNSSFPTEFARPFTGWQGAASLPQVPGGSPDILRQPWINGTVLRQDPSVPQRSLYGRATTGQYDDVDRSVIMRNQSLTRMANLTTNHSNSYLVRITMGYFEVNPTTGDLGREYLSDYGRNERFRATYVIDRSIPCNYVTGMDNDTERLILFRRYYKD